LTHGHEDHIGGLPYLLSEVRAPVWGPPHALALVQRRLSEHGFRADEYELRPAAAGQGYQIGPFAVEPVRVSHSIVEASALCLRTRAGTVVHTGDFNFDPEPPDGEPTDEQRLRAIGGEGVALVLSDSTNIDTPNPCGSEREVGATLDRLIEAAPARVIVAMFASNVQRLTMLGETAQRTGRRLCLLGRSLNTQVEVALGVGRLRWPSDLLVAPEQARGWPRQQLLVLAGGSQAERNSAMVRLAGSSHNQLELEQGDTVIMSSRIIPGNERIVFNLMSALLRKGVLLHTRVTEPGVHTSGHAVRVEQERMLDLLRPQAFLPTHGTLHHLLRHAELARVHGIPNVLVVENGTPVLLNGDGLSREQPVAHGKVCIGYGGEHLDGNTLLHRSELGRCGIVTIALALDAGGRLLGLPSVSAYGVPAVEHSEAALAPVTHDVARACQRLHQTPRDPVAVEKLRRVARRRLFDLCGCRPVVRVHIVETTLR
jgi:ribonuclease J